MATLPMVNLLIFLHPTMSGRLHGGKAMKRVSNL